MGKPRRRQERQVCVLQCGSAPQFCPNGLVRRTLSACPTLSSPPGSDRLRVHQALHAKTRATRRRESTRRQRFCLPYLHPQDLPPSPHLLKQEKQGSFEEPIVAGTGAAQFGNLQPTSQAEACATKSPNLLKGFEESPVVESPRTGSANRHTQTPCSTSQAGACATKSPIHGANSM